MDVVTTSADELTGAGRCADLVLAMLSNRFPLALLPDLAWPPPLGAPGDFTPAEPAC